MANITITFDTERDTLQSVLNNLQLSPAPKDDPDSDREHMEALAQAALFANNNKANNEFITELADESDDVVAPETPPITTDTVVMAAMDINGIPWDERIHAGSKALNKNGSWKARRGVDDSVVKSVRAELEAITPVVTPTLVDAPPPPASAPSVAPPPSAPTVTPSVAPPPAPAPSAWDWPTLLRAMTAATLAKQFNIDDRTAALAVVGLAHDETPLLANKPELFEAFANELSLTP